MQQECMARRKPRRVLACYGGAAHPPSQLLVLQQCGGCIRPQFSGELFEEKPDTLPKLPGVHGRQPGQNQTHRRRGLLLATSLKPETIRPRMVHRPAGHHSLAQQHPRGKNMCKTPHRVTTSRSHAAPAEGGHQCVRRGWRQRR